MEAEGHDMKCSVCLSVRLAKRSYCYDQGFLSRKAGTWALMKPSKSWVDFRSFQHSKFRYSSAQQKCSISFALLQGVLFDDEIISSYS